jgi:hypothetical protein
MIALEVQLNGKRLCLAGAEELGLIYASISAMGLLDLSNQSQLVAEMIEETGRKRPYFHLVVGGPTDRGYGIEDSHLSWCNGVNISVGDTLGIRIVEIAPSEADPPEGERPCGASNSDERERRLFERSKRMYFALREKYGDVAA